VYKSSPSKKTKMDKGEFVHHEETTSEEKLGAEGEVIAKKKTNYGLDLKGRRQYYSATYFFIHKWKNSNLWEEVERMSFKKGLGFPSKRGERVYTSPRAGGFGDLREKRREH